MTRNELFAAVFPSILADLSTKEFSGNYNFKLMAAVDATAFVMERTFDMHELRDEPVVNKNTETVEIERIVNTTNITKDDLEWVVFNDGDLGAKIGDKFFSVYKDWSPLERKGGSETDANGTERVDKYRRILNREFGESVKAKDYDPNRGQFNYDEYDDADPAAWKPIGK